MEPKQWARVRQAGAHGLRRGAWYAVVNASKPTIVFLDVNRHNVAMDRSLLDFQPGAPDKWSVVSLPERQPPRRSDWVDLEATYGVCPQCRARANLPPGATEARCEHCGGRFAIDWDHPC
jgi:LSD1 subclass zinc finger protein